MDLLTIFLIAIGLSMDAFGVSVAGGITAKDRKFPLALKMALFFGGFQALMPVLGWILGLGFKSYITGVDHWVAFGLLFVIGCRMIYESTRTEARRKKINAESIWLLLFLSIATSIDALAVGLSFAFLDASIALPAVIIGLVTFAVSFTGVAAGGRLGLVFGNKIEIAGGLILIGIGAKILAQHLYSA